MITLYSGIPGSGKSYKMVHDLIEERKTYYVVHNIDGMKKETFGEFGINWIEYCEEQQMEIIDFFSKEYQIEFTKAVKEKYDRNCLVIIDEAHEWFDKNKKTLKMWLSYHRHLNQEIWLVAHRSTNLPAIYRSFIEIEYRAKSSSIIALPGFFLYARIVGGEQVGYKFVRINKKVFTYYKSQNTGFKKQPKSLLLPVITAFIAVGVMGFMFLPKFILNHGNKKEVVSSGASSVSAFASVRNEKYRFAGKVGDQYLIEDMETGRTVNIAQLPQFLFMAAGKDEIHVYDQVIKKRIVINSYVGVVKRFPATLEPGISGTGQK